MKLDFRRITEFEGRYQIIGGFYQMIKAAFEDAYSTKYKKPIGGIIG